MLAIRVMSSLRSTHPTVAKMFDEPMAHLVILTGEL
jgi:hypothetical protein